MAELIKVCRDGETLKVHPDTLRAHEAIGWRVDHTPDAEPPKAEQPKAPAPKAPETPKAPAPTPAAPPAGPAKS